MAKKKQREKPPAFQFYAKDFLTGTMTMSLAERGAYISLLSHQWDKGGVPGDDVAALARLLSCERAEIEPIWGQVQQKFRRADDGVWRNAKLEKVRRAQELFAKKQAKNGAKGGRPRKNPGLLSGFRLGSENENPKKALQSSSASSVQVQTPPTPLSAKGGRLTRKELDHAKNVRRALGGCNHEPTCQSYQDCLTRIAYDARAVTH